MVIMDDMHPFHDVTCFFNTLFLTNIVLIITANFLCCGGILAVLGLIPLLLHQHRLKLD